MIDRIAPLPLPIPLRSARTPDGETATGDPLATAFGALLDGLVDGQTGSGGAMKGKGDTSTAERAAPWPEVGRIVANAEPPRPVASPTTAPPPIDEPVDRRGIVIDAIVPSHSKNGAEPVPLFEPAVPIEVADAPSGRPVATLSDTPVRSGLSGQGITPSGQNAPLLGRTTPPLARDFGGPKPAFADNPVGPRHEMALTYPQAALPQPTVAVPITPSVIAGPDAPPPAAGAPAALPEIAPSAPRSIRITLRPQELGEVQVTVRQEAGQLRVTIVAETEAGHAALTAKGETLALLTRDIRAAVPPEHATPPPQNGSPNADTSQPQGERAERREPLPRAAREQGERTQVEAEDTPSANYI